jgi:hypothetical protein
MISANKRTVSRMKHLEGLLQPGANGNHVTGYYQHDSSIDENDFSQHYKCVS